MLAAESVLVRLLDSPRIISPVSQGALGSLHSTLIDFIVCLQLQQRRKIPVLGGACPFSNARYIK